MTSRSGSASLGVTDHRAARAPIALAPGERMASGQLQDRSASWDAVAGQAEHELERLFVGESLLARECAPGVEAERDRDPGANSVPRRPRSRHGSASTAAACRQWAW